MQVKQQKRRKRHKRIRAKIFGTDKCPRFSVFRSNRHLFLQLVDDQKGKTLIGLSDIKTKTKGKSKIEKAGELGRLIAKQALKQGIKRVVFDKGGYKYHGRVKAAAEEARKEGLKF